MTRKVIRYLEIINKLVIESSNIGLPNCSITLDNLKGNNELIDKIIYIITETLEFGIDDEPDKYNLELEDIVGF